MADRLVVAESIYLRGQLDSARVIWTDALARADTLGDSLRRARILTWLGLTAYREADYERARSLSEQALALKLRLPDSAELARSYNALGLIAWNQGRLEIALTHFQAASQAARTTGDQSAYAKAVNNLALVHTERGEFREAQAGFQAARAAGARLRDPRIEGGALANLGMLEVQLGDPRAAIQHLQQARVLYRVVGFRIGEQNALGQLGTAYDALGEPGAAYAMLDSALQLSRRQGLRQEEASNLELLAGLHRQAGDLSRSLQLYREVHRLNEELGLEVEKGTSLRNVAEIQVALGRSDLARPDLDAALRIHRLAGARQQEMRDLLLMADIAARDGQATEAQRHLRGAGIIARALGARTARLEVALARAAFADHAGDAVGTLAALHTADADMEQGGYGAEWLGATLKARALKRLGRLDSAAAAGRLAVTAVTRVRGRFGSRYFRSAYLADKAAPFDELVDILLRSGQTPEAFEVSDASRSRALLESLSATAETDSGGRPVLRALAEGAGLLRRIDTLGARLDALSDSASAQSPVAQEAARGLRAQLVEARSAYERVLVQVAEIDGEGAALLGGRGTTTEQIREALTAGEALVEYYIAPEQIIAFVVTPAGVRTTMRSISRDDLARRARLARQLAGRRDSASETGELLAALHELLIAPVEETGLLRNVQRLVVVPHASLVYLPFSALRNPASRRYLVEDYSILTLPSAAALPALRGRDTPVGSTALAAVLAPFPEELPGSRSEATALGSPGVEVVQGAPATERRLRAALRAGAVVHVATHGALNARNPMFSRIELARGTGAQTDDGKLEIHEVLGLRIASPIVFLSGCETGAGAAWSTDFSRTDDYTTLAQAFLFAGAGTVIGTLWRVSDAGAAALAREFYHGLTGLQPAEALAEAQRRLIHSSRFPSPYHWAAYQVSGPGSLPMSLRGDTQGAHIVRTIRSTE
jgi:CHAT domain-containing protein